MKLQKKTTRPKRWKYDWDKQAGGLETNVWKSGSDDKLGDLFPIFATGNGRFFRTKYFLSIGEKGIRIVFHDEARFADLDKFPLNRPDTVELFVDGVERASTSLLGKLKLMRCTTDKIVYIVASRAPDPPVTSGLKPASKLAATPV